MLVVILIWLYVIATTYVIGYGLLKFMTSMSCMQSLRGEKIHPYHVRFRESYLLTGIIAVTLYAEVFSLFGGVGLWANLLLLMVCMFIAVPHIRQYGAEGFRHWMAMLSTGSSWLYLGVFFLLAFGTSHGIMHYDTGLYHAQAIHWIETFGAVKGLGNLHLRLAYNSAAFPLSALYSFSFLGKQSYHVMAGYFALLLAWQCVDLKNICRRKQPTVPDAARLVAIYYLFTIYSGIVSPASDYFVITLVCYIVIQWLDLDYEHEKSVVPYAFLSMAAVYAVTLKLSVAPVLLLAVKPVVMMLRSKRREYRKTFLCSLILGLITAVPFLIRNVILSGWLIYPFTALDLFHVSWKIPKGVAEYDAREIAVYGRGYTDVTRYTESVGNWFPKWFSGIGRLNQIMLIADAVSLVILIVSLIVYMTVLSHRTAKIQEKSSKVILLNHHRMVTLGDFLFVETVLYVQLAFWLFSSPLIRYGSIFILFPAVLMLYRIGTYAYHRLGDRASTAVCAALVGLMFLFVAYKSVRVLIPEIRSFKASELVNQQDYPVFEVKAYQIGRITFYYPIEGDQTGYLPFPSSPAKADVTLRGDSLADGFNPCE